MFVSICISGQEEAINFTEIISSYQGSREPDLRSPKRSFVAKATVDTYGWCYIQIFDGCRRSFVYAFNPAALGSNTKHTIYACINLNLNCVMLKRHVFVSVKSPHSVMRFRQPNRVRLDVRFGCPTNATVTGFNPMIFDV